jgi:hypothetical protein
LREGAWRPFIGKKASVEEGEAVHRWRGETVHRERGETVIERGRCSSMLWEGRTMNFHVRKFKVHMKSEFEQTLTNFH